MPETRTIDMPECMGTGTGDHVVVIFNNDHTPFEVVVHVLMLATACGLQEAYTKTMEAHLSGSSIVYAGPEEDCQATAGVIERAGVRTLVRPD